MHKDENCYRLFIMKNISFTWLMVLFEKLNESDFGDGSGHFNLVQSIPLRCLELTSTYYFCAERPDFKDQSFSNHELWPNLQSCPIFISYPIISPITHLIISSALIKFNPLHFLHHNLSPFSLYIYLFNIRFLFSIIS